MSTETFEALRILARLRVTLIRDCHQMPRRQKSEALAALRHASAWVLGELGIRPLPLRGGEAPDSELATRPPHSNWFEWATRRVPSPEPRIARAA